MINEQIQHYVYLFIVIFIFSSLIIYIFFLWGDKKRGKRIEDRGKIIFFDEPFEKREIK